jgi:hypothetical protein
MKLRQIEDSSGLFGTKFYSTLRRLFLLIERSCRLQVVAEDVKELEAKKVNNPWVVPPPARMVIQLRRCNHR